MRASVILNRTEGMGYTSTRNANLSHGPFIITVGRWAACDATSAVAGQRLLSVFCHGIAHLDGGVGACLYVPAFESALPLLSRIPGYPCMLYPAVLISSLSISSLSQELRVNECGGNCAPRTRLPDTACRTASTDIAIKKVTWVNEVNSRVV
jgi:hypothetical protein